MRASLSFSWAEALRIPPTFGPAVLAWLRAANGSRVVGSVPGGVLVQRGISSGFDFWLITDNGGELNVERVNEPSTLRSVPFHQHGVAVNAVTLATWIFQAMCGDQIDWSDLHDSFGIDEGPEPLRRAGRVARGEPLRIEQGQREVVA
ncbi:MAG: hypothetical protein AB7I13_00175 [Vicinamibacterales bacterium]